MSAICQYHQYGHCKFGSECDKIHTIATCDSFPCQAIECNKRHPKLCKYFSVYGRCMFMDRCSFLHYSFNRGDHTGSSGLNEIVKAVSELREEVKILQLEVDRLGNMNVHLLEMIKDLKEEIDIDRVKRLGRDSSRVTQEHVTSPEVQRMCVELLDKNDKTVLSVLDRIASNLATDETNKVAMMFKKFGGLHCIETLQSHENEMIYNKALGIIENFFPENFPDNEQISRKTDHRTNSKAKGIEFKENRTGKGDKKGGEKNLGSRKAPSNHGREQNVRKKT